MIIIWLIGALIILAIGVNKFSKAMIVLLFMFYYMFEGGLISFGNLAGIYLWLEMSQRNKIPESQSDNKVKEKVRTIKSRKKYRITW